MATIQEVLAAQDARKSPFTSFLEGAAGGFQKSQDNAPENAKLMLLLRQQQQEQQQQAIMQKQLSDQMEAQTQNDLKRTGGATNVLPQQKLRVEISQDEKGKLSRKWVTETPKEAPSPSFEPQQYLDEQGQTRIGKFDKSSGTLTKTPTDALAPKQPVSLEDKANVALQAKLTKEKPKAEGSLRDALRGYDGMIAEAEAIKSDPSLSQATGVVSPLSHIPGTGAKRVAARLETLKAKTLLNVLSSLKQLSATGASGFGALSDTEGKAIRDSISTLDPTQSTKDLQDSLDRFMTEMKARKQSLQDTFDSTYSGASSGGSSGGGGKTQKIGRFTVTVGG